MLIMGFCVSFKPNPLWINVLTGWLKTHAPGFKPRAMKALWVFPVSLIEDVLSRALVAELSSLL